MIVKYKIAISFILILFFIQKSFGQVPTIEWQRCYGGSNAEGSFRSLLEINDGYLLIGNTLSSDGDITNNHGGSDGWIVHVDTLGDIIWQKCYGGSAGDNFSGQIIKTYDGNFIVAANTNSNDGDVSGNHGQSDAWVIKIDPFGNILWQKCFGGTGDDGFTGVLQTPDSGFILCGETSSTNGDVSGGGFHGGWSDTWVVRSDSLGNILWQKCYGGTDEEVRSRIISVDSSGFVLGNLSYSNDGDISNSLGASDYWIFRIDNFGNIVWDKSFGGSEQDYFDDLIVIDTNRFAACGWSSSTDGDVVNNHSGPGFEDFFIVMFDLYGNKIWAKCFGGFRNDAAFSISPTTEKGVVISGETDSDDGDVSGLHNPNTGTSDTWVVCLDSSGTLLWQKCLGGSFDELGYSILQLSNGKILASSQAGSIDGDITGGGNHGGFDSWVVQLSINPDEIQIDENEITNLSATLISSNLHLKFASTNQQQTLLQLIDVTGRKLMEKSIDIKIGVNELVIATPILKVGINLIRLGNKVFKLISY